MPATHTKDELHRFLKPGMKLSTNFEFGPKDQYTYPTTYLGMKENAQVVLNDLGEFGSIVIKHWQRLPNFAFL